VYAYHLTPVQQLGKWFVTVGRTADSVEHALFWHTETATVELKVRLFS